ncbi:hypothetical protein ETD86_12865 [Nonomuraea turkmeniaca]|uniref:Uncharacterized protein n=2 Tax=Nonomuraea turkmeniaca TaxID=103838 RepID=A0A5S4FN89_9ACTN|nr:hypothetical protein ETD86_12865 [Nonomuraea turkmeniaca]
MSAEDGTGRGTPIVAYDPDGDPNRATTQSQPSLPVDPGQGETPAAVTTMGPISHALTCEGHDASEDGTGRGTPIVAYDLAQITSPDNRSNPAPGDPCPPLCTTGRPAVTAIPVALRGRAGESTLEHGQPGDPAYALRTPGGGSSMPMVATTSKQAARQVDAVSATVTAKWAKGTGGPAGDETQNLLPAYELNEYGQVGDLTTGGVRRLTPRECERLQGYPDDWTIRSGEKEQADSPRYRQLGNSLAVPVVRWAVGRLVVVDAQLRAMGANT